jgi:hypothetical protein
MTRHPKTKSNYGTTLFAYEIKYKNSGKVDFCAIWAEDMERASEALSALRCYPENLQILRKIAIPSGILPGFEHELCFSVDVENSKGFKMPVVITGLDTDHILPSVYQITDVIDTGKVTGRRLDA